MVRAKKRLSKWFNWFNRNDRSGEAQAENAEAPAASAVVTDRSIATNQAPGQPANQAVRQIDSARVEQGFRQMLNLVHTVRNHLNDQAQRSEQVVELMRSIPEANQNQKLMLQVFKQHLDQQSQKETRLVKAMNDLAGFSQKHNQSLTAIEKRLGSQLQSNQNVIKGFVALTKVVGNTNQSQKVNTRVLHELTRASRMQNYTIREMFAKSRRQTLIVCLIGWSMAFVALAIAGMMALA